MTIWNSGDATANIVLTGSSLIATASSASSSNYQGVRATTSKSTGKYYFEWSLLSAPSLSFNTACGWANASANIGGSATELGHDTNSFACFIYPAGNAVYENASAKYGFPAPGANQNDVLACAFDIDNLLVWFRVGGLWNSSLTANPATGTGGASVSGMAAGPYFPVFNTSGTGGSVQANFGATDFAYTIPSGFSALDTDTQAYNASAKFLGYEVLSPPQTAGSSSKLLGYEVLSPPQTAGSSSKLLGYVILQTLTRTPYSFGAIYG